MEQKKSRSYLIYAIGEIALVMIGILLALQVNNWNEQRRERSQEIELLRSLKSDFDSRLTELKYIIEGKKNAMSAIDVVIQQMDAGKINLSSTEMDSLLAVYSVGYNFNEKFSALDMLFNSGKINSISNNELRNELILWPTLLEEMLEEQRAVRTNDQKLISKFDSNITTRNMVKFIDFNDYDLVYPKSQKPNNYDFILGDLELENILFQRYNLFYWNITDGKKLVEKAEQIIHLINEEVTN